MPALPQQLLQLKYLSRSSFARSFSKCVMLIASIAGLGPEHALAA
jgi:hypothetical protein